MAISVKYFGSSNIPAFERDYGSLEDLKKNNPFQPFEKKRVEDNHVLLRNLEWSLSGHIGIPNKVAGWNAAGQPDAVDGGGVDGSVFGIDISETGIFIQGRSVILHSPGTAYVGAEWDLSAGASFSLPTEETTYYVGFDPDNTSSKGFTTSASGYPICVKLYTVGIVANEVKLTRVWNSGDVDVIAMWLGVPGE